VTNFVSLFLLYVGYSRLVYMYAVMISKVHLNTRREETVCETKMASEFWIEGEDVYWIRMTREWIQLLAFCEHINEPPEYGCLILTVRASQSLKHRKPRRQQNSVISLKTWAMSLLEPRMSRPRGWMKIGHFLVLWTTSSFSRQTVLRGL